MLIEKLEELISNGGFVMPPLLMCVCIAWWLIGKRWTIVRHHQETMLIFV